MRWAAAREPQTSAYARLEDLRPLSFGRVTMGYFIGQK